MYEYSDNEYSESAEIAVNEKHLQMIMDRQQAGKQIPARPVSLTGLIEAAEYEARRNGTSLKEARDAAIELARTSVECSQTNMWKSMKRSFTFPDISHIFARDK